MIPLIWSVQFETTDGIYKVDIFRLADGVFLWTSDRFEDTDDVFPTEIAALMDFSLKMVGK